MFHTEIRVLKLGRKQSPKPNFGLMKQVMEWTCIVVYGKVEKKKKA